MNEIAAKNLQRQESRILRNLRSRKACKLRLPRGAAAEIPSQLRSLRDS
jgi:hypothetical protein